MSSFCFANGTRKYHNYQTLLKVEIDSTDIIKIVDICEGNYFGRISQAGG
jgi:hypothetical protein